MATKTFVFLLALFGAQQNLVAGQTLDQLSQTLVNLRNTYSNQEGRLNYLYQQREKFFDVLFDHSGEYNNRRYVSSRTWTSHIEVAEGLCEIFGGYLVEINDALEHEFIKSFLNGLEGVSSVLTGMIRNDQEVWTYRHSGERVTYFDWATPEPTSDDLRCATIIKGLSWGMYGYPCVIGNSGGKVMCEVPNQ